MWNLWTLCLKDLFEEEEEVGIHISGYEQMLEKEKKIPSLQKVVWLENWKHGLHGE